MFIYLYILTVLYSKNSWKMPKRTQENISEIRHYVSLQDFAKANDMDWRTAKKKVAEWTLLLFLFREKRVYVLFDDLKNFLLPKILK